MTKPPVHLSLRAPAEIAAALDKIARICDRDRSWVMLRALRDYLDQEGREILEDAEAIAELDRGAKTVPLSEVLDDLQAIAERARKKHRRAG